MCSSSKSAEQLTLDLLFEDEEPAPAPEEPPLPTPGECPFERYLLEYGKKLKSKCGFRGTIIWTNCRDVGRCLWDSWTEQGTNDGLKMGGEDDDDDC